MKRELETEVIDSLEEVIEYDAPDLTEVNKVFAEQAMAIGIKTGLILDAGTGTARIPILICQQRPECKIIGIDLSKNMLMVGEKNIKQAGLENQIKLELVDAKNMPYPESYFDAVISNTIIHHLPDPKPFLQSVKKVLKSGGGIFLRDLIRPENNAKVEELIKQYAYCYNKHQQQLFENSLKAAFTVDEVREMLENVGLECVKVYQSSDRHWTAEREFKPV